MANKPIPMQKVRNIIQLYQEGYSLRKINRITGVHRKVITGYITHLEKLLPLKKALTLPEQEFTNLFKKEQEIVPLNQKQLWLNDFLVYATQEIKRKHVTRQLLYQEYQEKYTQVFSYSHFCELLGKRLDQNEYSMFQTFLPGEIIMADFAGDKLYITDKETGEVLSCEVLVLTLGYSGYTFAVALKNQTQECFVDGLNKALLYFGGCARVLRFDNFKAGVIKADRYEPTFNILMSMFCEHYGIVPDATRVRKPKDKAQVESHVNIVYQRIYAPLRNKIFHSTGELNHAIQELLIDHHKRPFRGTSKNRLDFYKEEQPSLNPLPDQIFKKKHIKKAVVQKNYHVWLGHDEHYYSTPYEYVGNKVTLIYDSQIVEIYHEHIRIALHTRKHKIGRYSTIPEHMPEAHVAVKNGTDPLWLKKQASDIGQNVLEFTEVLLNKGLLTPQQFKSCQGVLSLARKYPKQRVDNACKRALEHKSITYKSVLGILEKNLDSHNPEQEQTTIPYNPTARGPQSFTKST